MKPHMPTLGATLVIVFVVLLLLHFTRKPRGA